MTGWRFTSVLISLGGFMYGAAGLFSSHRDIWAGLAAGVTGVALFGICDMIEERR